MSAPRRFSQAISEGDGISLIARVGSASAASAAEAEGAEAILISAADVGRLAEVRAATSLPILVGWGGGSATAPGPDAFLIAPVDAFEQAQVDLADEFELALRIDDDEELAESLERFDPEIFVLAASEGDGEEALERVLDLLPDVPAGKLAIAELAGSTADDVLALERAGIDGVIVEADSVGRLAGDAQPEV
jgi:indole-3-glycerol phosphate synthase